MIGAMAGWASRMRLVSERKRSAHPSPVVSPRRYRDRSKETRRVSSCAPDVLSLANSSSSGSHVIEPPPTTPSGGAIIWRGDRKSKRILRREGSAAFSGSDAIPGPWVDRRAEPLRCVSGAMFAPAGIDVLAYAGRRPSQISGCNRVEKELMLGRMRMRVPCWT